MAIRIEAPEDPRLADYRGVKDGELLRKRGLFIVEGRVNVACLIDRSAYRPRSVLLSEPAYQALRPALGRLDPGIPVFVATRELVSEIAGFDIHRGCLAACERPGPVEPSSLLRSAPSASTVVVLEDLTDPDNVGAVFRNAMAFGVDAVFLSPRCCDPLYRKSIRVSMGAALCVPTARFATWPQGLEVLRGAGYEIVALHPAEGVPELGAGEPARPRTALLLGTEGVGLSEGALSHADRYQRIAMCKGIDSVNVATASGIALHDLFRGSR